MEGHSLIYSIWKEIKASFPDCHVSCCWRSEVDQARCFKEGTSRLRFPLSAHNAMSDGKPYSRAIDLFRMVDGKAVFDRQYYKKIAEYLKSIAKPIEWGGAWTRFADAPHFQLEAMIPQNWKG